MERATEPDTFPFITSVRLTFINSSEIMSEENNNGPNKCSVYVGNLSFRTSWQDLKDHMREIGPVENAKIFQMHDGRSKGSGLVTFENAEDAQRAIQELNQTEFQGREITVRADGGSVRPASKFSAKKDSPADGTQLYVGNLSWDTTWSLLKDTFKEAGDVERADVVSRNGRSRGFGFVKFSNADDAQKAIEMFNGKELDGRELEVRLDKKK